MKRDIYAIRVQLAPSYIILSAIHTSRRKEVGSENELVATVDRVKCLPSLNACINEGFHSTSSLGLPRVVPKGSLTVSQCFAEGAVLGVPSCTIHHDARALFPACYPKDVQRSQTWH